MKMTLYNKTAVDYLGIGYGVDITIGYPISPRSVLVNSDGYHVISENINRHYFWMKCDDFISLHRVTYITFTKAKKQIHESL